MSQTTDTRTTASLPGFERFSFDHEGIAHPVFHAGSRDALPVLLMQELAGLSPGLLAFADRLVRASFQVYLPWMFGPFGERAPMANLANCCIPGSSGP